MTDMPKTIWVDCHDKDEMYEGGEWLPNKDDWIDEIMPTEYTRADLAVKIKPLVWDEDENMWRYYAKTPFGTKYKVIYFVTPKRTTFELMVSDSDQYVSFNTLLEAKASAQAHYENLVNECLE